MAATAIVLLHGWGGNSRSWGQVAPQLAEFGPLQLLDLPGYGDQPPLADPSLQGHLQWLDEQLPARAVLVGFSLGGMLALAFAAQQPQRLTGLLTVASNLCFVATAQWPSALAPTLFESFYREFAGEPGKTIARFTSLACNSQRQIKKQLAANPPLPPTPEAGLAQLALLGELQLFDAAATLANTSLPVTMLFAEQDALVPVAVCERLAVDYPSFTIERCAGSHLLPLQQPERVVLAVEQLLAQQPEHLDKRAVAASFSRAAGSYRAAASLQCEVAEQLLALAPNRQVATVMDLGCASGGQLPALHQRYPEAQLVAADLALGMLQQAAQQPVDNCVWLCGDAESLPLAGGTVELLYSSFALQWCEQIEPLCAELARVVAAAGELLLAVPVAGTLSELRSAWARVDSEIHVNRFASAQRWRAALEKAGFVCEQLELREHRQPHRSVRALLQSIKAVGAHNVNRQRATTATGRGRLQQLYQHYPTAADGSCTATWQVLMGRWRRR